MASVRFDRITKTFGSVTAVSDVTVEVDDGAFVCLLGPSGCGKTTLLRMTAGLEVPTSGRIFIDEREITRLPPKDRNISMVFQDYALYPHMTLADNIAYPLKVRGIPVDKRLARAKEVADVLKIGDLLERLPAQISGGQQQRTSVARALVNPSNVYLFDEPLSNLDAKLRLEARAFLNHLQRDMGMTAIYVTHDQAEAMALATNVAVMDSGRVIQFAPPLEVYRRPATTFVANFVGNPPMNLIPVEALPGEGGVHLKASGLALQRLPISRRLARILDRGQALTLGIRPERLQVGDDGGDGHITGALFANENMGAESLVTMQLADERRVTARIFSEEHLSVGEEVRFSFRVSDLTLFDGDGRRIKADDE